MEIERTPIKPLSEQLLLELETVRREALKNGEKIEPTEEEKKNGWTTETLTRYLTERYAAQSLVIDVKSLSRRVARRPNTQNHKYNPRKWRC